MPAQAFRRLSWLGALAGLLLLGACSSTPEDEYVEAPVEGLYNEAMDALESRNYMAAADAFEEVERQHPYSAWATKAQLMAGYAYYEAEEYDLAVAALDRFIRLHPSHDDIAYAYYLRALCHYDQIVDVARDQSHTRNAMAALREVVARFPDSEYARDAKLKLDLTRDHLAGKEMEIGRFYQQRGYLLAALNRFKRVVEEYETTTHAPEALHRMVEIYVAMGLRNEARKTAAVLGHNFPGSEWYVDTYRLVEPDAPLPASVPDREDGGWFDWLPL